MIRQIGLAKVLGAMRAVGFKIYGSGWSASSDRPNRLAVSGRMIGDQRRGFVGFFLFFQVGLLGRLQRRVMVKLARGAAY